MCCPGRGLLKIEAGRLEIDSVSRHVVGAVISLGVAILLAAPSAKANDGCFTCKMAKAYATMSIATHQIGVWQTGDEFKICDIDADNVDTYGIIDKGVHLNTTRPVLGGAPVVIRVSVVVGTLAKGSGSYAEVDFKSKSKSGGELNYIWIPCVVASYAK